MSETGKSSASLVLPRPTPEQLRVAVGGKTPDIIAPGLKVLFCGINPSVYSAVVGHHFSRPGNRFWKAMHEAGFTPHQLVPAQDRELLKLGLGITNVASPATVAAADLSLEQLMAGGRELEAKVRTYAPRWLAVLGIGAYRTAFEQPRAVMGLQPQGIGPTRIWVLPNPSGLNAHFPPSALAQSFREFREYLEGE